MFTDTIITDEPDRIEKEERTGDTEGKETEEGDKVDSKDEGDQNRGQQISQKATGNIPTELIDLRAVQVQGQ